VTEYLTSTGYASNISRGEEFLTSKGSVTGEIPHDEPGPQPAEPSARRSGSATRPVKYSLLDEYSFQGAAAAAEREKERERN